MRRTGLVAPGHVGSSWPRARTRVPCIGRQILNHSATRDALSTLFTGQCWEPCLLSIRLLLSTWLAGCCFTRERWGGIKGRDGGDFMFWGLADLRCTERWLIERKIKCGIQTLNCISSDQTCLGQWQEPSFSHRCHLPDPCPGPPHPPSYRQEVRRKLWSKTKRQRGG